MRINKVRKALWDTRRKEGISVVITNLGGNKYAYEIKRWSDLVRDAQPFKKIEMRVDLTFTNGEMTGKVSSAVTPEVQETMRKRLVALAASVKEQNPPQVFSLSPAAHKNLSGFFESFLQKHAA